jgi:RNA polymerase sigma-70 factor (ECF subfamily)
MAAPVSTFGSTSSDLISRLRSNDPAAWERLVQLYGPLVFYWCRRAGLLHDVAADVFQEVFSAIAANVRSYEQREGSHFRGWLWKITQNKIHDHFRRVSQREQAIGGSVGQQQIANLTGYQPDEEADEQDLNELSGLLHRALHDVQCDFEERTWQAFWRTAVDGEETATVAIDLGITANSVRQARSRVLRRLREELGE